MQTFMFANKVSSFSFSFSFSYFFSVFFIISLFVCLLFICYLLASENNVQSKLNQKLSLESKKLIFV